MFPYVIIKLHGVCFTQIYCYFEINVFNKIHKYNSALLNLLSNGLCQK